MLEIEFKEAKLLKLLIDSLKDVSKEVSFKCEYEEISMQTMDESHVALIGMRLQASAFLQYRCDQECALGFDMMALHKYIGPFASNKPLIMRKAEGDQQVTFIGSSSRQTAIKSKKKGRNGENVNSENLVGGDEESENEVESDDGDDRADTVKEENAWNRTATMKLIKVEQESYQAPEGISFQADFCVPSPLFSQVIKGNTGVSDSLKFTAKPTTLELSVDADLGHTSTVLHRGMGPMKNEREFPWTWTKQENDDSDIVEMEVALAYLQKFTKACPISPKMLVSLSPGIPLRLKFPIEHRVSNGSYLEFFLAPKVTDADEDEMRY